jgi:hypothetical protein
MSSWQPASHPVPPCLAAAMAAQTGRGRVLKDLAVLTPPLIVCVAILIGIGAFLRHEMAPGRRASDDETGPDIPAENEISGEADLDTSDQRDRADAPDHD